MDEAIDSLEKKLAGLTPKWRAARGRGDESEALSVQREYRSAMRELWDLGWRGEGMYVDMLLPDEFMPDYYIEHTNKASEKIWERQRKNFYAGHDESPVPLELPRTLHTGQIVNNPPLHMVILPIEVYSTGALIRIHARHGSLPDQLHDQPDRVLIPFPDRKGYALQVLARRGLRGHALVLVGGRSAGFGRWNLEFWWPKDEWNDAPTARISWRVAGIELPLRVSTHELEAAHDHLPG